MKKAFKIAIIVELIIIFILKAIGVQVKSEIGNIVGAFLILVPPMGLLAMWGIESTKLANKIFAVFVFLLIVIIYVLASLVTAFGIDMNEVLKYCHG